MQLTHFGHSCLLASFPEGQTRLATYRAAHLVPGGVRTPLAMNLQAFAVNPPGR